MRLICVTLLLLARIAFAGTVDPAQYDAFWLWAAVKPQPVLRKARTVYVLQGQIEASPQDETQVRFIAQGSSLPRSNGAQVWLVYRVHTLRWTPRVERVMLAQLARWRLSGHTITGIQIDFDARMRHLQDYLTFLEVLRKTLPVHCRLSITGLLDWSSSINVDQVNQLKRIVDEVVIQTYQGRRTISNYNAYLPRVGRLRLPFRIGLVQGGKWNAPPYLAANPMFRGYVVFLLNS